MNLDKLEALANAATPGPWYHCDFTEVTQDGSDAFEISCTWPDFIGVAAITSGEYKGTREQKNNDCRFIAVANPQTIKALIALCRMQHEVLIEYQNRESLDDLESADYAADGAVAAFEQF
jgi:hypothetical protein